MATQRYISTSFWEDDWIASLDYPDRYFYMYLISNPHTNIAGVYKVTKRIMAFECGLDSIAERFAIFQKAKKAYHFAEEWVIIPSWPKHQRVKERSNIRVGIDRILSDLPENVWRFLLTVKYQYDFLPELPRMQKPLQAPSSPFNYSNLNSDSNPDLERDLESDLNSNSEKGKEAPSSPFDDDDETDPFATVKETLKIKEV